MSKPDLFRAISNNNFDKFQLLQTRFAEPATISECMHAACRQGRYRILVWLYDRYKSDAALLSACNPRLVAGFRRACENGHVAVAAWIHGVVDISARDKQIALHAACKNGQSASARWLSHQLTLEEARDEQGNTPLLPTCLSGDVRLASWLVEYYELTEDSVHMNGNIALSAACSSGTYMTRWLLNKFYSRQMPSADILTALKWAIDDKVANALIKQFEISEEILDAFSDFLDE